MRARFRTVLSVAAALLLAVTVAGSAGAWHWLCDLTSHFRWYWFLAAAVGLLSSVARPTSLAFVAYGLALAGNAWAMLPFWLPPGTQAAAHAAEQGGDAVPPLTLVSVNVLRRNRDKSLAVAYLRDRRPDVAVLLEIDADWAANLSSLDELYPHRIVEPRRDNFGIAVLSRWPLSGQRVVPLADSEIPAIETLVRFHDREIRLVAVHPHPPFGGEYAAVQIGQLTALAAAVRASPEPCIVAGDFNATPWSLPYRAFVTHSGLRDTALGRGVQPTWNARGLAPRLPIDHVFVSPAIAVLRRAVGPDVGSDHFPVEATLVLPPAD